LTGDAAVKYTEKVIQELKDSVDLASHIEDNFIAVKATSLLSPMILLRWSFTLEQLRKSYDKVSNGKEISFDQLSKLPETKNIDAEKLRDLFKQADVNHDGVVSFADINAVFSLTNIEACRHLVDGTESKVSNDDLDTAALIMEKLDSLCERAREKKVKVVIDAEQTYFQYAINDIIIGQCRKFNPRVDEKDEHGWTGPVIFNTYQMYLKQSVSHVMADVKRAEEAGYTLGLKLVRGAYMVSERERAAELGYESPIHETIEDTHTSYNAAIKFLIDKISSNNQNPTNNRPVSFVVASHNRQSAELACELVEKNKIPKKGGFVGFGQLMGMQDTTTHFISSRGFTAYKVY
jgi:proline dehydrogenase